MRKTAIISVFAIILLFSSTLCCLAEKAVIGKEIYTYEVLDDGSAAITGIYFTDEPTPDLIIPDEIEGKPVTEIGREVLPSDYSAFTITLPRNLRKFEPLSFWPNAGKVKKIYIPEGYDCPDSYYYQFKNLTEFEVLGTNNNYATIDGILYHKSDKRLVSYPCGLEVKIFEIPQGIKVIGKNAFNDNEYLNTVIIPDTVLEIEDNAFSYCQHLKQADLPLNLQKLGSNAFVDTSINEYIIGPCLTEIGTNPFRKLAFKPSIKVDEQNPRFLSDGKSLIDLEHRTLIAYVGGFDANYLIPENVLNIGDYAFYNTNTPIITIPEGVEKIGDFAFNNSLLLQEVNIPDSVKSIGKYAFEYTKVKTFTIPAGVESIGIKAFDSSVTLNVYHNSYAEQYAKENNIYFTYADYPQSNNDDTSWLDD